MGNHLLACFPHLVYSLSSSPVCVCVCVSECVCVCVCVCACAHAAVGTLETGREMRTIETLMDSYETQTTSLSPSLPLSLSPFFTRCLSSPADLPRLPLSLSLALIFSSFFKFALTPCLSSRFALFFSSLLAHLLFSSSSPIPSSCSAHNGPRLISSSPSLSLSVACFFL